MEPLALALAAVVAVATAGLILAERARSRAGIAVAKPVASLAFVALGWPTVDGALFAALVLCFLGDLCLIPEDVRVFRAGIVLFLLAHVAFGYAFLARGVAWPVAGLAVVPLVAAAVVVTRWILPTTPRELKPAVLAYVVVITAMVALAAGASWFFLAPALAFWTNDVLIARDRFVARSWLNRAFGLPLYYGAMVAFALASRGAW